MGYEIRLLIGKSYDMKEKNRRYFQIFVQIDLCKCDYEGFFYNESRKWKNETDTDFYFYGTDGNTEINEDHYNEKWIPQSIETVLNAIKKDDDSKTYQRFVWAVALLESMKDSDAEIMIFGY